jgi:hypothetical protein
MTALARPIAVAMLGILATAVVLAPGRTAALTCATMPGDEAIAITSGWPQAAPMEHVFIATVLGIRPERGDANTWGEWLTLRMDAVLRGDLPLATIDVFNPPLGSGGWIGFSVGSQFLIAASPQVTADGSDRLISTWQCAPNEKITSVERFDELVALSADPRISNTAMPPPDPPITLPQVAGLALVATAVVLAARRRMGGDGSVDR